MRISKKNQINYFWTIYPNLIRGDQSSIHGESSEQFYYIQAVIEQFL